MKTLLTAVFLLAATVGCKPTDAAPERLVGAAFKAIQARDYVEYRKYMLTRADLEMQATGQTGFKQKMGYAGAVLKPEELKEQRADFDAAASGARGLDFSKAEYVGIASSQVAPLELLSGGGVEARVVTLKVRINGQEQEAPAPAFLVIPWHNGRFRLVGMVPPR